MSAYGRGRPRRYNAIKGEGCNPPPVVGEYRIRYSTKFLKYIGITNDLNRRMHEHIKSGKIDEDAPFFDWLPALPGTPYDKIRDHEGEKISLKNPEANQRGGRGGKNPKKLNYLDPDSGSIISMEEYQASMKHTGSSGRLPKGVFLTEIEGKSGRILYGIRDNVNSSVTKRFIVSRIIRFILKLVVIAGIAVAVAYVLYLKHKGVDILEYAKEILQSLISRTGL